MLTSPLMLRIVVGPSRPVVDNEGFVGCRLVGLITLAGKREDMVDCLRQRSNISMSSSILKPFLRTAAAVLTYGIMCISLFRSLWRNMSEENGK
jgi:hypothetical protein